MRDRHVAQPGAQRSAAGPRRGERLEQAIQRAVLTEEEDLVLAAEVVIQVAGREGGGVGDLPHARGGEAARAEDARRRPHDFDAPGVGPHRTAVRKVNHGSILAAFAPGSRPAEPGAG